MATAAATVAAATPQAPDPPQDPSQPVFPTQFGSKNSRTCSPTTKPVLPGSENSQSRSPTTKHAQSASKNGRTCSPATKPGQSGRKNSRRRSPTTKHAQSGRKSAGTCSRLAAGAIEGAWGLLPAEAAHCFFFSGNRESTKSLFSFNNLAILPLSALYSKCSFFASIILSECGSNVACCPSNRSLQIL